MKNTFNDIEKSWNWERTWGWDYPMAAMCATRLGKPEQAIEVLNEGIDYIIEDNKMLQDFYKQLSIAYTKTNNTKKAQDYSKKANKISVE